MPRGPAKQGDIDETYINLKHEFQYIICLSTIKMTKTALKKEYGMLDLEKIRLMTKLAIFEKKEGKNIIEARSYYKADYISNQVLKTLFHFTVCFILIAALLLLMRIESILLNLNLQLIRMWVHAGAALYLGGSVFSGLVAGISASVNYDISQMLGEFYSEKLEKLLMMQTGQRMSREYYSDNFQEEIDRIRNPSKELFSDDEEWDDMDNGEEDDAIQFAVNEAAQYMKTRNRRNEADDIPGTSWNKTFSEKSISRTSYFEDRWLDEPSTPGNEWLDEAYPDEMEYTDKSVQKELVPFPGTNRRNTNRHRH